MCLAAMCLPCPCSPPPPHFPFRCHASRCPVLQPFFSPRYGAWGSATTGGKTLQLRALDWDVDGPFKNYPQITVYHPNKDGSNGHAFANIGWYGWL